MRRRSNVATHRPESLEWGPFEGIGPGLVEGVRGIKAKDGADLIRSGSSTVTSALLEHGLANEVVLLVNPVLLGKGKRAFLRRELRHAHLRWKARKLCRRASSSIPSGPLDLCRT
jgi:dihydrofolate reductase